MKQPSENMRNMYAQKKGRTLQLIQDAIDNMRGNNCIVTKKELMSITGLSSGTFSRDYVKALLQKNKVCQYRSVASIAEEKREKIQTETMTALLTRIQRAESQIQSLKIILEKECADKKRHKAENDRLSKENLLLKGKYQQALEFLEAYGVDLSKLPLV